MIRIEQHQHHFEIFPEQLGSCRHTWQRLAQILSKGGYLLAVDVHNRSQARTIRRLASRLQQQGKVVIVWLADEDKYICCHS